MACRDEVFDSQEMNVDEEENAIPDPRPDSNNSRNTVATVTVATEETENESQESESEEDEDEEGDGGLHVPSRKRKLVSPVWTCGAAIKTDRGSKCTLCGKEFLSKTFNTSNIIKHILDKHKNNEASVKLKEEFEAKKKKVEELKKVKEKKAKETKTLSQSSMLTFTTKAHLMDPLKKKRIEDAIIKYVVVENESLSIVEKHSFRNLLFQIEPSYICPSHTKFTRMVDSFVNSTREAFIKELAKDLSEVEFKTVQLTSDHGTSSDRFHSHKNVLTVTRCTKDFQIKTDLVALISCEGSQTGEVIRTDIKNELDKIGRDDSWLVDWVTDGEAKQVNARAPGKHPRVGLNTYLCGTCVDHTLHLR